ncbi:hypothetical protein CDAR_390511 [Caerostris darwini]|uniref:Uncharacterized protein n=1 Tax=Caerostris darwini TaxID=1538125 RepID=A0AAV4NXP0_9ARAC|nr:hypothetical protein CDAR_390511 [Caerostris darwini]
MSQSPSSLKPVTVPADSILHLQGVQECPVDPQRNHIRHEKEIVAASSEVRIRIDLERVSPIKGYETFLVKEELQMFVLIQPVSSKTRLDVSTQ